MKKMQEKSKEIQIYKANHKLPSNQAIVMANIKLPRKEAKREESRGLVKMSVNCLSVSIKFISLSLPSQHGLSKSGVSL
jgi:hypothetical protein